MESRGPPPPQAFCVCKLFLWDEEKKRQKGDMRQKGDIGGDSKCNIRVIDDLKYSCPPKYLPNAQGFSKP